MMEIRTVTLVVVLAAAAACSQAPDRRASEAARPAAGPVTLTLENSPSPPATGPNTLVVVVRNGDGTPVNDAAVTGLLFMPVMESMGKTPVEFRPEGAGRYSGRGNITMAGSWQVTVTAARGGATLATRTFNLTTKS